VTRRRTVALLAPRSAVYLGECPAFVGDVKRAPQTVVHQGHHHTNDGIEPEQPTPATETDKYPRKRYKKGFSNEEKVYEWRAPQMM
jgi:hypothetical protein